LSGYIPKETIVSKYTCIWLSEYTCTCSLI